MTLPTFSTSHPLTIGLSTLTPGSFSSFGTVITSPIPASTSNTTQETIPTKITPPVDNSQPYPIFANQKTALKTSPISPLINNYPPSSSTKPASTPLMSLFTCFPRPTSSLQNGKLRVSVLERHPYTTQTFTPLGHSPSSADTSFIVVVAPPLPSSVNGVECPPDLANLKAFVARGDQAVTYGVGTWHAPMIVLGKRRVNFLVTQFVNGTGDDCEEVAVVGVDVELGELLPERTEVGGKRREDRMLESTTEMEGRAKL